jgi:hypothetical protein
MQIADKYTVICYDSTVETLTLRCTWVYFTSARPITECGQYCPLFAERRPGAAKRSLPLAGKETPAHNLLQSVPEQLHIHSPIRRYKGRLELTNHLV